MKIESLINSLRIYRISERLAEQHQHHQKRRRIKRKKIAAEGQNLPSEQDQTKSRRPAEERLNEAVQFIAKFYSDWEFELSNKDNEALVRITESSSGKLLRELNIEELFAIETFCKSKEEGAALPSSILDVQA